MPHWIVVLHEAHHGRHARDNIRRAGFQAFWPRRLRPRTGRGDDIVEPLFPGYLFAEVKSGQSWGAIRGVPNVLKSKPLLTNAVGEALVVPAGGVQFWLDKVNGDMDGIWDDRPKVVPTLPMRPGIKVHILPGTLAGVEAEMEAVVKLDWKERVKVLLQIMGGERVMTLPKNRVVLAEPPPAAE